MAVAEVSYIGGHEGPTEYWWMRISPEGKRTQVTEPRPIPYQPLTTLNPLVTSTPAPTSASTQPVDSAPAEDLPTAVVIAEAAGEANTEGEAGTLTAECTESTAATTGEVTTPNAAALTVVEVPADPRYYKLTEGMK